MRKILRKKEIKELRGIIKGEILKNSKFEYLKDEKGEFIFIDEKPALFKINKDWIPTLYSIMNNLNDINYKQIIVDAGAIKFVVKGADVMRPGITNINFEIIKGEFVLVKEETHDKVLGIGIALFNGQEMNNMTSGKVVKSLHYVGDFIWNKKL